MSAHHLPANPNLNNLRNRAKQLLKDHSTGDAETWARWRFLPKFAKWSDPEIQSASVSLADAQSVIARECGFVSWRHLKRYIETPDELKALGRSIEAFDGERARQLLKRSPELAQARLYNSDAEDGTTVLGYAVWADRKEASHIENMDVTAEQIALVEALLDAGANVNEIGYGGMAPLGIAAWLGKTGFVELLLVRGADPHFEPQPKNTALAVAADHNHTAIVERLIQAGARYHAGQLAQAGLIDRLTLWLDRHPDQVNELVDLGHLEDETGTLLHSALDPCLFPDRCSDYERVVQLLLSRGVAVNTADNKGRTPLDIAQSIDTPMGKRVVELLHEHEAEAGKSD